MYCVATRREALVGGASVIATVGMSTRASAAVPRWVFTFTAGVAAGWLVEALKHWGLVPGSKGSTSVAESHRREVAPFARDGYGVTPMYSGAYAHGDYELSEARRQDELVALGTTNHATVNGSTTCTPRFYKTDAIQLGLVSNALSQKGLDRHAIQSCVLPLHPNASYRLVGDRRYSPDYMTPSHGTIAWSTNVHSQRPNLETKIRSPVINANLRFATTDRGKWTFDMVRV